MPTPKTQDMKSGKKRKRNANPASEDGGDDDAALFRRLMADARRLEDDRVPPHRRRARPRARFARQEHLDVLRDSLERDPETFSDPGDHLHFRQATVNARTMRRLARGDYSTQAELDLHGLTASEARAELVRFIADCVEQRLTCVRVIHGKGRGSGFGGPVLKPLVDQWLRRLEPVLAFVTARPVDGGTGAVYVLLRRP